MNPGQMDGILTLVAAILLATVMLGLIRIWLGPEVADRMLTAQLFGSTGVALLLVLSELQQMPPLRDVALTLSLLAVMATVAFVSRVWRADRRHPGEPGSHSSPGDRE